MWVGIINMLLTPFWKWHNPSGFGIDDCPVAIKKIALVDPLHEPWIDYPVATASATRTVQYLPQFNRDT